VDEKKLYIVKSLAKYQISIDIIVKNAPYFSVKTLNVNSAIKKLDEKISLSIFQTITPTRIPITFN
jgi:hypothetical protein